MAAGGAALAGSSAGAQPQPRKLGIGLIGCGGRGAYLASLVESLAGEGVAAEIVAVCDICRFGDSGERGMPVEGPNAAPGPDLNWDAFQADAPQRAFSPSRFFQSRMYMDYSGGPATDLYPHPMPRLFKVLGASYPTKDVAVGGNYVYNGERDVPDTFALLIEYPEKLTVAVLGTITNQTGLETVIRRTEGTITLRDGGFDIEPAAGSAKGRRSLSLPGIDREHMRNFLDSMRTRKTPNCDIELGYRVQLPLIMAMMAYVEGKVAYFDAATETIRLG